MKFPFLAARTFAFFLAPWLTSAALKADEAFKWTPVEIDGRDYLSTEEIGRFYDLKLLPREGRQVVFDTPKVLMKMEVGSTDCTMNGTRFIFETPVVDSGAVAFVSRMDLNRVLDPVLRPNLIKSSRAFETVVLDPFRGGEVAGAAGEADPSLAVAKLAAKQLESRGFKVVLTRVEGPDLTDEKRLELVNGIKVNAVFIRIDFNPGGERERGLRTAPLFLPADGAEKGPFFGQTNMALATALHGTVARMLGKSAVDRGIKSMQDPELGKLVQPVVTLTGGSLSDPDDARLILSQAYQKTFANGIAVGVVKYRTAISR